MPADRDDSVFPVPLERDRAGVLRVSGTRVTLDTVISAFDRGASPEEIASRYPTVPLPDIYAVIAYYLSHRDEVEAHLNRRRQQAADVRAENERRFPSQGVGERLMASRHRTPGGF